MEYYSDVIKREDIPSYLSDEEVIRVLNFMKADDVEDLILDAEDPLTGENIERIVEIKRGDGMIDESLLTDNLRKIVLNIKAKNKVRDIINRKRRSDYKNYVKPCHNPETTVLQKDTLLLGDKQIFFYEDYEGDNKGTPYTYCFDTEDIRYILKEGKGKNPYTRKVIPGEDLEKMKLWRETVPQKLGTRTILELNENVQEEGGMSEIDKKKVWIADLINKYEPYPDVIGFLNLEGMWWKYLFGTFGMPLKEDIPNEKLVDALYVILQSNLENPKLSSIVFDIARIIDEVNYMYRSKKSYLEMVNHYKSTGTAVYSKPLIEKKEWSYYTNPNRVQEIEMMDINNFNNFLLSYLTQAKNRYFGWGYLSDTLPLRIAIVKKLYTLPNGADLISILSQDYPKFFNKIYSYFLEERENDVSKFLIHNSGVYLGNIDDIWKIIIETRNLPIAKYLWNNEVAKQQTIENASVIFSKSPYDMAKNDPELQVYLYDLGIKPSSEYKGEAVGQNLYREAMQLNVD